MGIAPIKRRLIRNVAFVSAGTYAEVSNIGGFFMTLNSFTQRLEEMARDNAASGEYVTVDLGSSGQSKKVALTDIGDQLTIAGACIVAEVDLSGREVRLVRAGETKLIGADSYSSTPILHADRIAVFDKETGNLVRV
jgi:hypothetical protein